MSTYSDYLGIDVSKLTLDVMNIEDKHFQYSNDLKGFKKLAKIIPKGSVCIMEVTGIYHLQLAAFLHSKSIAVSVVNPLRIKRFIQMHLKRNKTDKADAKMISLYGKTQAINLWEPVEVSLAESKEVYHTMEQFINMRASLKNKLEELKSCKSVEYLIDSIELQIVNLSVAIKELEMKVVELVKKNHASLLSNLNSIIGIGERTATLLIISTDGFKNFDCSKQLSSYFGLSPTETSSGTSINGSRKISKMGNPLVRKKLYMCSLQASRYNKTCVDLYQRLVAKGKPKKLALIAVTNKLLRISFAISKSGIPYDSAYKSYQVI